jgi:hypothetical protein
MSKVFLVYQCDPNEGPEPKRIGSPFNFVVTPGEAFECNEQMAKALLAQYGQFKQVDPPAPLAGPVPAEKKKGKSK